MTAFPVGARLAVVERRDRLRVLEMEPDGPVSTSLPGRSRWPAWIPGPGKQLVFSRGIANGTQSFCVANWEPDAGTEPRTLFQSPAGDATVIAPRVPHYVLPSPGGGSAAIVAATSQGLALYIGGTEQADNPPEPVAAGAPLFPAWDPSGRFLAVHVNSVLMVIDTLTGEHFQSAAEDAVGFRTPAYADDGNTLAFATVVEGSVQLEFSRPDGTGTKHGPRFPSSTILQFRPGTNELYAATVADPNSGLLINLWKALPGKAETEMVYRGPFAAFSWSPSGDRILLIYPTHRGDGSFGLYMLDPAGAILAASEPIVPSDDQRIWLTFFDQYGKSHVQWLNGGESIVFCGRAGADRIAPSLGDSAGPMVYAWSGARGAPLEAIVPGEFAVGR